MLKRKSMKVIESKVSLIKRN